MATASPQESQTPGIVTVVAGAVLAIASFLTWVTVKASVLTVSRTESAAGTSDTDGWITFVCGVVAIIVAGMFLAKMRKPLLQGVLAILAGAVGLIVGLIDYSDASNQDAPAGFKAAGGKIDVSVGIGLYLVIIAGIAVIVGGVLLLRSRKAQAGIAGAGTSFGGAATTVPPAMTPPATPPAETPPATGAPADAPPTTPPAGDA